jgi:hypothetical protein
VLPLNDKNNKKECQTFFYRKIDNYTVAVFQLQLSYENWDEIFVDKKVNIIFNSFLNTYLRIFNASFLTINKHIKSKNDITWVTQGIKTSCKPKRELYLMMKKSVNTSMKTYYDKYCKILKKGYNCS